MNMGVIDTRDDSATAEVYNFRGRPPQGKHLGRIASREDALTADCDSLHIRVRRAAGENLSSVENQIRCRGLCHSQERENQSAKYGSRTLQPSRETLHFYLRPQNELETLPRHYMGPALYIPE